MGVAVSREEAVGGESAEGRGWHSSSLCDRDVGWRERWSPNSRDLGNHAEECGICFNKRVKLLCFGQVSGLIGRNHGLLSERQTCNRSDYGDGGGSCEAVGCYQLGLS